jgi:hypothetical protein
MDIGAPTVPDTESIEEALLSILEVSGNFVLFIAHLVEFLVSQRALTIRPYQVTEWFDVCDLLYFLISFTRIFLNVKLRIRNGSTDLDVANVNHFILVFDVFMNLILFQRGFRLGI